MSEVPWVVPRVFCIAHCSVLKLKVRVGSGAGDEGWMGKAEVFCWHDLKCYYYFDFAR